MSVTSQQLKEAQAAASIQREIFDLGAGLQRQLLAALTQAKRDDPNATIEKCGQLVMRRLREEPEFSRLVADWTKTNHDAVVIDI